MDTLVEWWTDGSDERSAPGHAAFSLSILFKTFYFTTSAVCDATFFTCEGRMLTCHCIVSDFKLDRILEWERGYKSGAT
jgi:hypothetical protein